MRSSHWSFVTFRSFLMLTETASRKREEISFCKVTKERSSGCNKTFFLATYATLSRLKDEIDLLRLSNTTVLSYLSITFPIGIMDFPAKLGASTRLLFTNFKVLCNGICVHGVLWGSISSFEFGKHR